MCLSYNILGNMISGIVGIFSFALRKILFLKRCLFCCVKSPFYGNFTSTSFLLGKIFISNRRNLFMYENTNIYTDSIIMNRKGKFIMKKNSGAAVGLTVITGNHMSIVGMPFKEVTNEMKTELDVHCEMDKDIVVEEDVWLGARVTLLVGSHIGRGAIVGAGSVVRSYIPPYSIVLGNPAKIVGFRFLPEEIIEHEKELYPEEQRLAYDIVVRNYNKYFTKKIRLIKEIISV